MPLYQLFEKLHQLSKAVFCTIFINFPVVCLKGLHQLRKGIKIAARHNLLELGLVVSVGISQSDVSEMLSGGLHYTLLCI